MQLQTKSIIFNTHTQYFFQCSLKLPEGLNMHRTKRIHYFNNDSSRALHIAIGNDERKLLKFRKNNKRNKKNTRKNEIERFERDEKKKRIDHVLHPIKF